MTFTSLRALDVAGKKVLVRADLNVPMQDGKVSDLTRLERLSPTLDYLSAQKCKIILMSHFGRPKGVDQQYSLEVVAHTLNTILDQKVSFCPETIGPIAQQQIEALPAGEILVLENLRFNPGEEKNDHDFGKALASLGDVYVNDAFSASHRAHASIVGIPFHLPSAAGFLMEEELNALQKSLEHPKRPVAAIVGGAKISTKLELLDNLVKKVDLLILGGGMANSFLFAKNVDIGASLCEKEMRPQVEKIMKTAKEFGCEIILPIDVIWAKEFKANIPAHKADINAIPSYAMVLDIGPKTVKSLEQKLKNCPTIVWNGPMGAFEISPFDEGTVALANFVAQQTKSKICLSVAGGGDTVAALVHAHVERDFSYVSSAGGAFLEWLEGKELPGVRALRPPVF